MDTNTKAAPRYFYRCRRSCCNVVAVDGLNRMDIQCACGGVLEGMGRVRQNRLTRIEERCACDGRCTSAVGPACDCQCGGKNHGSHKTVEVVIDLGGVPRIQVASTEELVARAAEFNKAVEELDAAIARWRLGGVVADIRAGRWVSDRGAWEAANRVILARKAAKALKTHGGRIKALAKVAASLK